MKQRTKCILKRLALTFVPALTIVVCMVLWITYSPGVISWVVNPCGGNFETCTVSNSYPQTGTTSPSVYIAGILILIGGYATYQWAIKPCLVKEAEDKP